MEGPTHECDRTIHRNERTEVFVTFEMKNYLTLSFHLKESKIHNVSPICMVNRMAIGFQLVTRKFQKQNSNDTFKL